MTRWIGTQDYTRSRAGEEPDVDDVLDEVLDRDAEESIVGPGDPVPSDGMTVIRQTGDGG